MKTCGPPRLRLFFKGLGVSRDDAVVVVRPDQYVAAVLPLAGTRGFADLFDVRDPGGAGKLSTR